MCDRYGCDQPGNCPAPKSPNSPERWYFCQEHAGEYNRGWNYFEGLTAEEAAAREADETRAANGFAEAKHYSWGGPGDGTRSRDEMRALEMLELDSDADFEAVRVAWRVRGANRRVESGRVTRRTAASMRLRKGCRKRRESGNERTW